MKFVHVIGPSLAAFLVAACGANPRQVSAPQRAAQQAEEDKRAAQDEAREARTKAEREQTQAQEAQRAERGAERNAQWATQRAALAEEQAAHDAQLQRAPRLGATERQPDGAARIGVPSAIVLFAANTTELSLEAKTKLDQLAKTLRTQAPAHDVIVEGYTDDAATESANVQVSQERARAVAKYLESKGVAADRIATRGMGSLHLAGKEATDRGRALNRRVEVTVQPAEGAFQRVR